MALTDAQASVRRKMSALKQNDLPAQDGSPFRQVVPLTDIEEEKLLELEHVDTERILQYRNRVKTFVPISSQRHEGEFDDQEKQENAEQLLDQQRRDMRLALQLWNIRALQKMQSFREMLKNKDKIIEALTLRLKPKILDKNSTIRDINERIAQADEELMIMLNRYDIFGSLRAGEAVLFPARGKPKRTQIYLRDEQELRRVKAKEIKYLTEDLGSNNYRTFHTESEQEFQRKKREQETALDIRLQAEEKKQEE